MITSSTEYHLIAELIGMKDRELAEKIELHIWYNCSTPQPLILASYLKALRASEDNEQFQSMAREILNASGLEFFMDQNGWICRTLNINPPGYVAITAEQMFKAEDQEPK